MGDVVVVVGGRVGGGVWGRERGRLYTYRYTVTTRMTPAGEPKRIRTDVPLLTSLTPYR